MFLKNLFLILIASSFFFSNAYAKGGEKARRRKAAAAHAAQEAFRIKLLPLFIRMDEMMHEIEETRKSLENMPLPESETAENRRKNLEIFEQRPRFFNEVIIDTIERLYTGELTRGDAFKFLLNERLHIILLAYENVVTNRVHTATADEAFLKVLGDYLGKREKTSKKGLNIPAEQENSRHLAKHGAVMVRQVVTLTQSLFDLLEPEDFDDEMLHLLQASPSLWPFLENTQKKFRDADLDKGGINQAILKLLRFTFIYKKEPCSILGEDEIDMAIQFLGQLEKGAPPFLFEDKPFIYSRREAISLEAKKRLCHIDAILYKMHPYGAPTRPFFLPIDKAPPILCELPELPEFIHIKRGLLAREERTQATSASRQNVKKKKSKKKPVEDEEAASCSQTRFELPESVLPAYHSVTAAASSEVRTPEPSEAPSSEEEVPAEFEEAPSEQELAEMREAQEIHGRLEVNYPQFTGRINEIQELLTRTYLFNATVPTEEQIAFLTKIHRRPARITLKDVKQFWNTLGPRARVIENDGGQSTGSHRYYTLKIISDNGKEMEHPLHRPHKGPYYSIGYVTAQLRFLANLVIGNRLTP